MVLFAKGQPERKTREMDGQMPFEEWIYGQPPQEVDFVRINGNQVIRLEVAKMDQTPVVYTKNEVEGLMRTDGTPLETASSERHTVEMGDVERNPDTQAPAAPPTLRNPGEKLPSDNANTGVMKPVRFPKPRPATRRQSRRRAGRAAAGTAIKSGAAGGPGCLAARAGQTAARAASRRKPDPVRRCRQR